MFYLTKVSVQWSPASDYELAVDIRLKPANRTAYTEGLAGATLYQDTCLYITASATPEEHEAKLRTWVLFHALVFDSGALLMHQYEAGTLKTEGPVDSYDDIAADASSSAYVCDYDDIGAQVYFPSGTTEEIRYQRLFEQYSGLNRAKAHLARVFLYQTEPMTMPNAKYSLFKETKLYWQITNYVTVLEAIIGHAPNCTSVLRCDVCGRSLPPHRQQSEAEWNKNYLTDLGIDTTTRDEYLQVLAAAYSKIRHPVAHGSALATPTYLFPLAGETETYDVARSIEDFGADMSALYSLSLSVREVTRYLLLNHLFALRAFPGLRSFHVTSVGPRLSDVE